MTKDSYLAKEARRSILRGGVLSSFGVAAIAAGASADDDAEEFAEPAGVARLETLETLRAAPSSLGCVALTEPGRSGLFVLERGDFAERVARDPAQAVYVPASDQPADAACWARSHAGPVDAAWFGARGDGDADDAPALNHWLAFVSPLRAAWLRAGVYRCRSRLELVDAGAALRGEGFRFAQNGRTLSGSVLRGEAGVDDLLVCRSDEPDAQRTTAIHGLVIQDMAFEHVGSGSALTLDNVVRTHLARLWIDCANEGAMGLDLRNWAFFFRIDDCHIQRFARIGLRIDGKGSMFVVMNCHVHSTHPGAETAIEVRQPGAQILGGQLNVKRPDGLGWAVVFDAGLQRFSGGLATDVLVEHGRGVLITSERSPFAAVRVRRLRASLQRVTSIVTFDNARDCVLEDPIVINPRGGGILASWRRRARNCGVICDLTAALAPVEVEEGAVNPWMRVKGQISRSQRDQIPPNDRLTVICEDVNGLGACRRVNGAWNRGVAELAADSTIELRISRNSGTLEISPKGSSDAVGKLLYNKKNRSLILLWGNLLVSDSVRDDNIQKNNGLIFYMDFDRGAIVVANTFGRKKFFKWNFDF